MAIIGEEKKKKRGKKTGDKRISLGNSLEGLKGEKAVVYIVRNCERETVAVYISHSMKASFTVSWNAVLFLLNNKFPAYLFFSQKEMDFEPDSSWQYGMVRLWQ